MYKFVRLIYSNIVENTSYFSLYLNIISYNMLFASIIKSDNTYYYKIKSNGMDTFNNPINNPEILLDSIFSISEEGMKYYQVEYNTDNENELFEVFIFCLCLSWIYNIEKGNIRYIDFFKIIMVHRLYIKFKELKLKYKSIQSESDMHHFLDLRIDVYTEDLIGMLNSSFPNTKQYLPWSSFILFKENCTVFYKEKLTQLLPLQIEKFEEVVQFTSKFIELNDWTMKKNGA